jgi:transcriptional regulator GlxA family with amidase domain
MVVVWADDDVATAAAAGRRGTVIVRGRRRLPELLSQIGHRLTATVAFSRVTPPTSTAIHAVAAAFSTVSVADIASAAALSTRHLARVFRHDTGLTLKTYLLRVQVEAAKELLRASDANLDAVAGEVGLYDASHLRRLFRRFEGVSPSEFRSLERGMSETS